MRYYPSLSRQVIGLKETRRAQVAVTASRAYPAGVDREDSRVSAREFEGKVGCDVGRPGEVNQARWASIVLDQGQPLEVILVIGDVIQVQMRFPLKDADDPRLLLR